MVEMHYDMLSVLYKSYLDQDLSYPIEWFKNYHENNVGYVFANLYFMSLKEMKEELNMTFYEDKIDVLEMFRLATDLYQKYSPNAHVVYSIEGCDYIKDEHELEQLYQAGLRSLLLVWNNPNKYGGGTYSDIGLTKEGRSFIKKAIDLGIIIDLSHANKKTFYDLVDVIKEEQQQGKKVLVIASHSNSYEVCQHPRNLDDEQLQALKEINALVGVVSNIPFISKDKSLSNLQLRQLYLKHIEHIVDILGIDQVALSTDNMQFAVHWGDKSYEGLNLYEYAHLKEQVEETLKVKYNQEEREKLMHKNAQKLIEQLK